MTCQKKAALRRRLPYIAHKFVVFSFGQHTVERH